MKKQTSFSMTLLILLLMILLLCYPNISFNAAQEGLLLWFNKVLPSLLPFMILVNILVPLNGLAASIDKFTPFTKRLWKLPGESLFAFIIGLIAGYPMGARVIKSLYDGHKISHQAAEQTLLFSNNCGPLFIIGTVGTTMLGQTNLGFFLFFIHLLSACIMSLLITHYIPPTPITQPTNDTSHPPSSFFKLLNLSVMQSMDAITCVGGYMILFSVLIALFTHHSLTQHLLALLSPSPMKKQLLLGVFSSLLELSNGTYALSQLPPSPYSLALLSAAINFGGICVYFQTLYVLEGASFNTKSLLIAKGIQSILSVALTLSLYPLYASINNTPSNLSLYTLNTYPTYFLYSLILFSLCLISTHYFFGSSHLFSFPCCIRPDTFTRQKKKLD